MRLNAIKLGKSKIYNNYDLAFSSLTVVFMITHLHTKVVDMDYVAMPDDNSSKAVVYWFMNLS
jgi:hypothetical protein